MQHRAREKHNLVLLRHDAVVTAGHVGRRVVKSQLSATEWPRLAMEKVNERHPARCDYFLSVVAVCAEKVSVVARRDLSFRMHYWKLLDPQLFQNQRQGTPDSFEDNFLMFSQLEKHARTSMVVIKCPWFPAGRNYLAAPELHLMLQCVGNKFLKLLRSQEFIQNYAL